MRARGLRLSSKKRGKPLFPNRKSAVISSAVVLFLLVFAIVAIDQNNVSRLKRYRQEATVYLDKSVQAMDERFMYAQTLVGLLEDRALAEPFLPTFDSYAKDLSPSSLSTLYSKLDKDLALLQKKVFTDEQYPLYAAYFEKIYEAEQKMAVHVEKYNEKAHFYTVQKGGFPASFAAKRLEMPALELFTIGPAMKGRP